MPLPRLGYKGHWNCHHGYAFMCVLSLPLFDHSFLGKSAAVLRAALLRDPHNKKLKSLEINHVSLEAGPLDSVKSQMTAALIIPQGYIQGELSSCFHPLAAWRSAAVL